MTATQLDKKIETVLETLILKGKTSGTLPFDEIHTAIPAASLGVNALETLTEILDRIEDAGIQVAETMSDALMAAIRSSNWSVYGRPLSDGSSAVMVLNRAEVSQDVELLMEGLHVRAARARHDDEVVADVEVLADLVDPDI